MLVDSHLEIEHCYPMSIWKFLDKHSEEYQDCPNSTCSNIIRLEDDMINCELCNAEIKFGEQPFRGRYMAQYCEDQGQQDIGQDMQELDFDQSTVADVNNAEQNRK